MGVSTLKQNLADSISNMARCPNCPKDVKIAMQNLLKGKILIDRKWKMELIQDQYDPPHNMCEQESPKCARLRKGTGTSC